MYKHSVCSDKTRKNADLVILPVWAEKKMPILAAEGEEFGSVVKFVFSRHDFSGKEKELQLLYRQSGKEPRVLLLGLGEKKNCTLDTLRLAYAAAIRAVPAHSVKSVNILFPEGVQLDPTSLSTAIIEGALMASYSFDQYKGKKEPCSLQSLCFCSDVKEALLKKIEAVIDAVDRARDLVNGNADDVNVETFKKAAKDLSKKQSSRKVAILDKKALEKEKMGLILGVGKGAFLDPAVIILEYRGDPHSKQKIAVVGKGITFDTGGLNLKGAGSAIETMKSDMAGAAAVVGIIQAAATLKLKVNLVGALAVAENAIGPESYKPGDVYRSHSGQTVEISNTDAEGRLVLADTISYVEDHYHPTHLIDFATLTGGVVVALGEEASGLFSNDEKLAGALQQSGERTHERLWRLPLYPEYKEALKSSIADLKNCSAKRFASAPSGATFIQQFVKSNSWAHVDIAGTSYLSELKAYHPTAATGVGVRLFIDFLENLT